MLLNKKDNVNDYICSKCLLLWLFIIKRILGREISRVGELHRTGLYFVQRQCDTQL